MCTGNPAPPDPPPVPAPPPDYTDEQVALSREVADQEKKRAFAGLSSTLTGTASGAVNPGRTSLTGGKA